VSEERISIKIRLKYSDVSLFQRRFSPYMSQYGMFLPTRHLKNKGTPLFFEFFLANNQRVFYGEGTVVQLYPPDRYPTAGLGIRFTALDQRSQQLLMEILAQQTQRSDLVPKLSPGVIQDLSDAAPATQAPPPTATGRQPARATAGTSKVPTQQPVASSNTAQPWNVGKPNAPETPATPPPAAKELPLFYGKESEIEETGPIIGIDLGTTNSCCAIVEGNKPHVIPSRYGYNTIPSIVAYDERGNLLIGHPAKSQMMLNPHNTVYGSKRLVGRKYHSPIVQIIKNRFLYEIIETEKGDSGVRIDQSNFTLQEVSALILTEIKEIAQSYLEQPINRAVISVPAYYNDNQRQAVREAGLLAGLKVERIVNEPTAAALAYGFGRSLNQKLLVYDLGGGTFDASVLQIHKDVYEVISTGGNTFLGGVDFDSRLIDYVLDRFYEEHQINLRHDAVKMQRIKDAVEKAKCDLSHEVKTDLIIPYIDLKDGVPLDINLTLDREVLNSLVQDLVEETVRVCDAVLSAQNLKPQEIDEVILVGGQTRMPLIHQRLTDHFGKPPHRNVHPDEAVALGTAILAYSFGQSGLIKLVDVLAMSIGIGLPGGRFKVIAPRNHKLPFEKSYTISTTRDDQTELEIVVFQGESSNVADNEYLGTMKLQNIQKAPRGKAKFDITFHLNNECILKITAKDLQTGLVKELVLSTRDTPEDLRQKLEMPAPAPAEAVPPPIPTQPTSHIPPIEDTPAPSGGGVLGWIKKLLGRR
tara:strand:+ start:5807 stop:8068 length:2262 start_codon:yes stop_codon:yes gene_type:complete